MHPALAGPVLTYGAVLVLASLIAVGWASGFAPRRLEVTQGRVLEMAAATLPAGLVAAKLPLLGGSGLLSLVRSAGFLEAGVVGGLAGLVLYLRATRQPVLRSLDAVIACAPLGAAVGRLGCLAAGCCYGAPSDLPWRVVYTDPRAALLAGTPLGVGLHPAPVYLGLASLVTFLAVRALAVRARAPGTALVAFLALEGASRLALDRFRGDGAGGLVLPALLACAGLGGLAVVRLGSGLRLGPARGR